MEGCRSSLPPDFTVWADPEDVSIRIGADGSIWPVDLEDPDLHSGREKENAQKGGNSGESAKRNGKVTVVRKSSLTDITSRARSSSTSSTISAMAPAWAPGVVVTTR